MRRIFSIILILIITCSTINCLEYESQIGVKGTGHLYANSNTGLARDHIDSEGEQNYYRGYFDQIGGAVFISKYNLTNPDHKRDPAYIIRANRSILISDKLTNSSGKGTNAYSISSAIMGSPAHFMGLSSDSRISSINWVERKGTTITTNYQASTNGELLEKVIDRNYVGRPKSLAETRGDGEISIRSGLKNNATLIFDTDVGRLVDGLESVKLPSETGKVNLLLPKTELSINGEKKQEISGGGSGTLLVGNREVEYNLKGGVTSEKDKSKKLDELKNEKNVSVYEVYKDDIISWQKEKIENATLTVDIKSDPASGPVGSIVNFTITLRNFGQTRFDRTSVINKLPPEMVLINQPADSIFKDGYIYWPAAGPLEPGQRKDITFQVRINEKIPASIKDLNDSVEAEGVTADKTIDPKPTWIKFTIQRSPMIVEMYADRDEISTGEEVTYTINIKNTGKVNLKNVLLSDSLPRGMDFVSSTSGVKPLNGLVTWKGDSLSSGEIKTLTYVARVAGDRIDGEILNNSVAITAQNNLDEEVKAENSTKIEFVKGQDIPSNETMPSNEILVAQSVPGSEKIINPGINFTLKTQSGSTTVLTGEDVYFDIILRQIGNATLKNVSLDVKLDPGMELLSLKDLNVSNGSISWPMIDSINGEFKKSFVATVKDTNADKTKLYVSARVRSKESLIDDNETLELAFKLINKYEETEHSIIVRQIDEGVLNSTEIENETNPRVLNAGTMPDINLTLNTDPVSTFVMTDEEVYFDVILKPVGNTTLKNVSLDVKLDPGLEFLSPKDLNVSNGSISWPMINSISGELKKSFVAKVKDTNADKTWLYVSARVKSEEPLVDKDETLQLKYKLLVKYDETEHSILVRLIDEVVPNSTEIENETNLRVLNAGTMPDINLTLNTDPVSTSVMTDEEVYFDVILKPVGNTTFENVSLEVKLDPGLEFLSPKNLIVSNGSISWPRINSISGELKNSFIAKVKDTNADKTWLYVSARVKSEEPFVDKNETLQLKFKLLVKYDETEHSIISRQINEGVPMRKILTRPSYQLGEKLIWDRYAYTGWVQPRPKEIEYFIVNETQENATGKKAPALIGSVGKKN
jgi:uncharacterized repeat protein (TIGR01451 family)